MTQPKVLAITLNWRQPTMTLECVAALRAMAYPRLQILVIDNGSGDESTQLLREELAEGELYLLPENAGFASGCNAGLRHAIKSQFDYALLINNDAFPAQDMLDKLLAETAPEIGLLSPKIYYESEPTRLWFANGRQHPLTLDLRDTGRDTVDGPEWAASHDVDYLLGTCLLVNLQALQDVGLIDERYFMYFEDLDWSLRFRQLNFRLRLVADAHLYHRIAISSGGLEAPLRRYYLGRSSVIFWRQHARLGKPWIIFFFRLGSALKMLARLLFVGKPAVASAYLRGLRDGWRIAMR